MSSSPDSFHSAKGITRSNSAKSNSSTKSKGPRAATHRRNKRAAAATKSKYLNEVFIDNKNNIGRDGEVLSVITDDEQLKKMKDNYKRKKRYERLGPPLSDKWMEDWKKQKMRGGRNALTLSQIHHELMNNSDMGSFHRIGDKKKTKRRRKTRRKTKRRKC